jgi:hypothetical protein
MRWVLGMLVVSLVGCMDPYRVTDEYQNGKKNLVVVTKDTELRSFLGTNGGGDVFELCESPIKKVFFYLSGDFTNCQVLKPEHPLYALLHHKQSRGAGPDLLAGAFVGAGLGASGGTTAAASASAAASNTAIQTVTQGRHHRR